MTHPAIQAFFNGAYDMLAAAFTGSAELSSATKGAIREQAARSVLGDILPPILRIERGDLIDSYGAQSGQLDGVIVEQRAPAFRHTRDGDALLLAEGAVAVLEFKSNIEDQWDQVEKTFRKLVPIRPRVVKLPPFSSISEADLKKLQAQVNADRSIPLIVIGHGGWATSSAMLKNVVDLRARVERDLKTNRLPPLYAVSLKSRSVAVSKFELSPGHLQFDHDSRGGCLTAVLLPLLLEAQRLIRFRAYPWDGYFGGVNVDKLREDPNTDWISGVKFED